MSFLQRFIASTRAASLHAPGTRKPSARFGLVAIVLVTSGCAGLGQLPPGTTLADATQRFGEPTTTCPQTGSPRRVVWSQQPSGSYAWGADVDSAGRLGPVTQVLDDAQFARLGQGVWTPESVRCQFGEPYRVGALGLGQQRQVAWGYRYVRDARWHSVMTVYFGADGREVTGFVSGPDDRYQRTE